MEIQNCHKAMNLHIEFSYLNTEFNEQFLSRKLTLLKYYNKDIICNGSRFEEKSLNIIKSGQVRVLRVIQGSQKVLTYDLTVGHIFGIENIIFTGNIHPLMVSAIGEVEIYRIQYEDILEQLQDPSVLNGLFKHYIQTMNDAMNVR